MDDSSLGSNIYHSAIQAALDSNWQLAIKINKEILKTEPQNIDALNRMARANFELRKYNLAKKYYSLTLKFDPYNPIALKNLKILKATKSNGKNEEDFTKQEKITSDLFLQEPGKTKIVNLLKVAEPQKLSLAYPGMEADLLIRQRGITITHKKNGYLGVLPDDLSHQIIRLIRGGNKYRVFIKAVRVNGVTLLIKETFRSKRFKNQPSFLDSNHQISTADMITARNLDDELSDDDDSEEIEEAEI